MVGQIVDPKQCLVRYFIVFQAEQKRHFLLPGDLVQNIDNELHSTHSAKNLLGLPAYHHRVTEQLEREIEALLDF